MRYCYKPWNTNRELGGGGVQSERERETHSKGSDQEACGYKHPNLQRLSVGLTLIHWSRAPELLAWSGSGALWSICRIAWLIVGIRSIYPCRMITAWSTQDSESFSVAGFNQDSYEIRVLWRGVFPLFSFCLCLCVSFTKFLFSLMQWVSGRRRTTVSPSRHQQAW